MEVFWIHEGSGYRKAAIGKRATCKLCSVQVAHSGETTNLKNHLRSHHRPEYRGLYGGDLGSSMEDQSKPKMDVFFFHTVKKLSSGSARVQQLTCGITDFVVRNLRPVNVVESVGFLHLMEVAESRYMVPCCRTINSYIDKR